MTDKPKLSKDNWGISVGPLQVTEPDGSIKEIPLPEKPNTIWMPYEEYMAQKEFFASMEKKALIKMRYFFWNNFSMEGFDEYYKTLENERVNSDGNIQDAE